MKKLFLFVSIWLMAGSAYSEGISLTLDETMRLAIDNSLDIQIAQYDLYIARYDLPQAQSIFDTFLSAQTTYDKNKKQPVSSFTGTRTVSNTHSVSLSKQIPSGTRLEAYLSDSRNSSDSPYAGMSPYHEVTGGFAIQQSLGKNFFGLADRSSIKITRMNIENAEYTSQNQIEQSLYEVETAYWTLALRTEELIIRRRILKDARNLYRIYQEKYTIGTAEKTDYLAAEANVRTRENEVFSAILARQQAKNNLLFLLNNENLSIDITVADSLRPQLEKADVHKELDAAVKNRRDYKKIVKKLDMRAIEIVTKKNSLWPEIDLTASYERNGVDSKVADSFTRVSSENKRELYLGVSVRFSLENNLAKSGLKKSELEKTMLLSLLKQTERLIVKEITNKTLEVNSIKDQAEISAQITELQQQKLEEEIKASRYGRSNSDIIVRYENDLLSAALNQAHLLYSYRIAKAGLETAKNTLLERYWYKPEETSNNHVPVYSAK